MNFTNGPTQTFEFSAANWVIIGLYLFGIFLMGLFFYFQRTKNKLQTSSQEYFKASNSLPGWAVGMSVFSTTLSAITFVSIPANTFTSDWVVVIGAMIIPLCAPFIVRYVIPFYRQLKANTAYGYIRNRYNHASQIIISIFFIFYQTLRIGVVTYLPTIVLHSVLPNINSYVIAAVIATLAILTQFLGGTKGVIWVDVVQALFLTLGILLLVIFGMAYIGNENDFAKTADFAYYTGKYVAANRWILNFTQLGIPMILMTYLVNVLYALICGHDAVQRYQSAKNLSETKKSLYMNSFMYFITFFMFYGFGTILYQLFTTPYSLGSGTFNNFDLNHISSFGVAYFSDADYTNGINQAIPARAFNNGGYIQVDGVISPYTNFVNVDPNDPYIKTIMINGQKYGRITTTAIVPYFVVTAMPIGISGFIIAAIMAAGQSTSSSSMSSGAEVMVRDIILHYHPNLSGRMQVFWGKVTGLSMGLIGFAVTAGLISGGVSEIYLFFNSLQGIFGAPVIAAFLMGMFGTYVRKNAMTMALIWGHIFALIVFLLGDGNIAKLTMWNNSKAYFSNQWNGVFVFAFVIILATSYQFFENLFVYKNPFGKDEVYLQTTKNLSWANMSVDFNKMRESEWSIELDANAYTRYVHAHYRNKKNSKDFAELQKNLVSFAEFAAKTSYQRYYAKRTFYNNLTLHFWKKPLLSQNELSQYRAKYLQQSYADPKLKEVYEK